MLCSRTVYCYFFNIKYNGHICNWKIDSKQKDVVQSFQKNRYLNAELNQTDIRTHIDEVVIVSDEEVAEDAGLVEVPQADHVLHPLDGGGVHRLDPPLRRQPLLFAVVVHHLKIFDWLILAELVMQSSYSTDTLEQGWQRLLCRSHCRKLTSAPCPVLSHGRATRCQSPGRSCRCISRRTQGIRIQHARLNKVSRNIHKPVLWKYLICVSFHVHTVHNMDVIESTFKKSK